MPLFTPGARPSPMTFVPATQVAPTGDTTLNPVAVNATQTAHTASASMQLRFVAGITALQAPAIVTVQLTERLVASINAHQAPHSAALQGREDFVEAITATQSPATASLAALERFVAAASMVQSPASAAAALTETDAPSFAFAVGATQAPHHASLALDPPAPVPAVVPMLGGRIRRWIPELPAKAPAPRRYVAVAARQSGHHVTAAAAHTGPQLAIATVLATQAPASCRAELTHSDDDLLLTLLEAA
jgi:hypothetical protein